MSRRLKTIRYPKPVPDTEKATPKPENPVPDTRKSMVTGPDCAPFEQLDPRIEGLVTELIGRVADKWTMLVLEVLAEHGKLRFTPLGEKVTGISQKMLTQTLRAMERDGLVQRTVHPVVPPKVEYELTDLGFGLGQAFCGVWIWAEKHLERVEQSRAAFDQRAAAVSA